MWEPWKRGKNPQRLPRTHRFVWRKAAAARLRQGCTSGTGVDCLPRPDWPRAASRAGRPTRRARPAPWGWPMGRPQPRQPDFFCIPALHLSHGGQPTPPLSPVLNLNVAVSGQSLSHMRPDADVQPVPGAEMANPTACCQSLASKAAKTSCIDTALKIGSPMIPSHPHAHRGRAMETVQPLQPPSTWKGIS